MEILLFLGIVFWCFLLFVSFQGRLPHQQNDSLSLSWDGNSLNIGTATSLELKRSETFKPAPAAVTPFFFQPLPINFADAELLSTISGIGPTLAAQIIETRDSHGFFTGPQGLLAVPGIGQSRMKQFASQFSFNQDQ